MATGTSKIKSVAEAVQKAKRKAQPAKKRGAAKKRTAKPTTRGGQGGAAIELSVDRLNAKEGKVFAALNGTGSGVRAIMSIAELAETCFKSQSKAKGNSWTRNSLRRLVQGGLVEKVERGRYRVTESGRRKLARAA